MGVDSRPSRPNVNPLSREAMRLVQQEQAQLLDDARNAWISMADHPFEQLSQEKLLPQVKSIINRIKAVEGVLGSQLPIATDSSGTEWNVILGHFEHETATLNGNDPNAWGPMIIDLREDPKGSIPVSVTDVLIYKGYDPIVEVNTKDAITIAGIFFDAIIKPYEKALGIGSLTPTKL